MVVRILFSGLMRGNADNWCTLKTQIDEYNAEIYVGSQSIEEWRPFFKYLNKEHLFETNTCTTKILDDTNISQSTHHITKNTIIQWSNLYLTYKHFEDRFADSDIVIKLRNDWYIDGIIPLDNIENSIIYVPSTETHAPSGFDENIMMNDQIVLGRNNAMKIYYNYPYKFSYSDEARTIPNPHPKTSHGTNSVCNGSVVHPFHTSCGIEIVLRNYIRNEGLGLRKFELKYRRILWEKPEDYWVGIERPLAY